MNVQIPIWGIIIAILAAMVIGTLWYSPMLFGKQWRKIIGISEKEMKAKMVPATVALVIISLIAAYVLTLFIAYFHSYYGGSWMLAGFDTALLVWLGFGLTTLVAHGIFEPRDKDLIFINAGNRLVTLVAMGLILAAFMK